MPFIAETHRIRLVLFGMQNRTFGSKYQDPLLRAVAARAVVRRHLRRRVKLWLDALLWERTAATEDVYRMKGVLAVEGSTRRHVLQVSLTLTFDSLRPAADCAAGSWS
jgi:hypothetical protein